MADAAVEFLLAQVIEVIKSYKNLISGAEQEFNNLKKDVENLKAILKDTAEKWGDDEGTRLVKNDIRNLIHEVEDAIDNWLTESKGKGMMRRGLNNLNFAKKVKSLGEDKMKDMLEKANQMKRDLAASGTSRDGDAQRRSTVSDRAIRQDRVVGRDDEVTKIKDLLKKDQTKLDVISIIGLPGLGKTTLAWKIYNEDDIGFEFPIRIWVQFSQWFNNKNILVQIMKNFSSDSDDVLYGKTNQMLSHAIHTYLKEAKFLLVVDDVWETGHWDELIPALPFDNGKGKVLLTSRNVHVGSHVTKITAPHPQRPLRFDESWKLLQLEVFDEIGSCPDYLKVTAEYIAEKCEGVPMTIVVIGGFLKHHYSKNKSLVQKVKKDWEEIAKNVDVAIKQKGNIILDVVALSYKRLPEHLRDCFLYLGVIPAGYDISMWTLTRLWIAEGFIKPVDGNNSLENTAEEYLNDLISRNLLIVRKMNPMLEVKTCRVHDIIRAFCTTEALKQNLFKEIRMSEKDNGDMQKIHGLCIHSDLNNFFSVDLKGPHVRSFLCFRKDTIVLDPKYNLVIPEKFPLLRILHSKSIKFNRFPQNVTKLNHLRYIVLFVADLKIIPEPISRLWNLQTIVVETTTDVLTMKANLWEMIQLRHVKTKAAIVLDIKNVKGEAGEKLQTLNRVSPESVASVVAAKASNLVTLGIRGELATLFGNMKLEALTRLEKLKLYHAVTENRLQGFPEAKHFPQNLKRLTLSDTFLEWKHMSTLAMIRDLEVLKLKNNAFKGISWEVDSYAFKNLQFLLIYITDLVDWEASTNAFPRLRHLSLKNCESLKEIPASVLQKLDNLDIDRVRKSIADSARLWPKIKLSAGPGLDLA